MELQLVFSKEEIQERVKVLGDEISRHYGDEPVVAVCVLKGAFMFFTDLVKQMKIAPNIDFVRLSSYANATSPGEKMIFSKDIETSLDGKHLLIVEDIVDTGHSIQYLTRVMDARGAKSIKTCALMDKKERREVDAQVDFKGFDLDKGFIVGYGIDYAEQYRNLDAIYEVIPDSN